MAAHPPAIAALGELSFKMCEQFNSSIDGRVRCTNSWSFR